MKTFEETLKEIENKYPKGLKVINDIGGDYDSLLSYYNNYSHKSHIDIGTDQNANRTNKDITVLEKDMFKGHKKFISFKLLFENMTEKYGYDVAYNWLDAEYSGKTLMHDAYDLAFKPYCYAYSLKPVVEKGLFFMNHLKTTAPKHLDSYNRFVLNFISYTSNRTDGAVGLPDYLIYSYYFWKKDTVNNMFFDPSYSRIQSFQSFIYDLNEPYLRVIEAAFTNINIYDRNYIMELFGGEVFPDGTLVIDHIEELIEHQKVFLKVLSDIREHTMFTFPVLSYSLLFDGEKFIDKDFARWCSDHNVKWMDSNFFVSRNIEASASCCRFTPNLKDMDNHKKQNGFFNSIGGSLLNVGSIRVNDVNLHHMALISKDEDEFFANVRENALLILQSLDCVRNLIKRNVDNGLLDIYKHGLIDMNSQYNTLGIASFFETIYHFGGIDMGDFDNASYNNYGTELALKIFKVLNEVIDEFPADYLINIEQSPNESGAVKLAKKDNILFNSPYHVYGNQFIPLTNNCLIWDKIKISSILDNQCNGGAITHINVDGFSSKEHAWNILNNIARSGLIYFAFNKRISVCSDNHAFHGELCHCGKPKTDEYVRIVGFLRPISSYSKDRKIEYKDRRWYESKWLYNSES